ncbi:N-acetylglucosamine-6-phosphate deacetylase [Bacillus sp. B1-b2]|uniref:N-acetylglucosamine-6-phosphate deacetylase n=1 Tax=Bacillus sp. B1-b2 TaxID=2653201 RepID=UPI00126176FE|nr:N-acetylglucosamine-6-phosphate deacetylase [Bacillus sp. B1-b2]KAB7667605.1 N-acetylglucosamine-6-phosphate deacetylase [Bacillus sp. B1-b2]
MLEQENILVIKNVRIYAEEEFLEHGYMVIKNGTIFAIEHLSTFKEEEWAHAKVLEFPKEFHLIPGFIDIHIHGANDADAMDASIEALETMAKTLPEEGTTSFLATTMTQPATDIERALSVIGEYMDEQEEGKAEILGVHLEGPFISSKRAGAQPLHAIKQPDVEQFKKWNDLSKNQIKLVTLAPEENGGLELVQYLKSNHIIASMGHSDAIYEEILASIQAGLNHVTHLYNGMRGIHHRDPGVAGAALLHPELMTEMIVDGIHIHPSIVKLTYQVKGADHIILITDSMRAKGLEDGVSSLGGQTVLVKDGKALLENGALAGSTLKMIDAIHNMMNFTGCSLEEVIKMASYNPAKQIGVLNRKGSIAVGKDADLVVLDQNNQLALTICQGQIVYVNGGYGNEINRSEKL